VLAPPEDKSDDTVDNFYEELEHSSNQFLKYHMKILVGDFSAKVGREHIFKPRIGNESLCEINKVYGVRVVNFATSKKSVCQEYNVPTSQHS
jgi:hypothetical protein